MFGIGSTEFLVILLVALLVLGPKNLSKVTRTVGKYVGEFRRVSTEFQRTLNAEVAEEERQENREAVRKKAAAAKAEFARRREEMARAEAAENAKTAMEAQAQLAAEQAAAEEAEDRARAAGSKGEKA